jgi:5-methylthioadenosine/S-adenosylhomocysteine deaminase
MTPYLFTILSTQHCLEVTAGGGMSHKPRRTLIDNLAFVLTCDAADTRIDNAAIVVEDDRIAAIGRRDDVVSARFPDEMDSVIDGSSLGAAPGFVDTHVHLSETLSRASFPDNLDTRGWVFHWAKPFYAHVNDDDERLSVLLGTSEMLRSGTTCFLDMGAQNDPEITATAAADIGIRGIVGRHAADNPPDELPPGWTEAMVAHHFFPTADGALKALREAVEMWNGYAGGRIRCWVNIEGKEPCSLELHIGARALAEELGVGTTYHIASSIQEAEIARRRFGTYPITRIAHSGGLGSNLVLAHAVAVRDEEIPILAEARTKVAFCPGTSLKLGKGAAKIGRYPEMIDAGVMVGLGTDGVAASGNLSLMRQIHLVAGLFKDARIDESRIGARKALRMATIDGAAVLGWQDEIGSLEVGKKADLVLFDLEHHEWTPFADPLQALVWSASPASVAQTWVNGECVYRDGWIQTVDEKEIRARARVAAAQILARAGLDRGNVPTTTDLYS